MLIYWLYKGGELVDEYNSDPAYFDDNEDPSPSGGDWRALSQTFGVTAGEADLERVLRTSAEEDEALAFATDRHRELTSVLGLPATAVGTGYTYLEQGEAPLSLEIASLRRV